MRVNVQSNKGNSNLINIHKVSDVVSRALPYTIYLWNRESSSIVRIHRLLYFYWRLVRAMKIQCSSRNNRPSFCVKVCKSRHKAPCRLRNNSTLARTWTAVRKVRREWRKWLIARGSLSHSLFTAIWNCNLVLANVARARICTRKKDWDSDTTPWHRLRFFPLYGRVIGYFWSSRFISRFMQGIQGRREFFISFSTIGKLFLSVKSDLYKRKINLKTSQLFRRSFQTISRWALQMIFFFLSKYYDHVASWLWIPSDDGLPNLTRPFCRERAVLRPALCDNYAGDWRKRKVENESSNVMWNERLCMCMVNKWTPVT